MVDASASRSSGPRTARVLPDVAAIGREFDYSVPEPWQEDGRAAALAVGSMVRVELHGRRVAGWITELDPEVPPDVELRPLAKLSGRGPAPEVVELARWAAFRWAGPVSALLGTASPPRMVSAVPRARPRRPLAPPEAPLVGQALDGVGAVVRIPPLGDRWPFILGAVARGNALVLVPSVTEAHRAAGRLGQLGIPTAVVPRDWARAAGGATVVGGRAAAFAPVADLAAVVVLDEHAEVYQEERSPTWHAREVVLERARRAGVPCVLTSPMPTPEACTRLPLLAVSRDEERRGWPTVLVVDPREDAAARGTLWSHQVVRALQGGGRAAVVINRKGRSRLLACSSCAALAVCDECGGSMRQDDPHTLTCATLGHTRPVVCAECGATGFKNLRIGVTRAREELEALLREPVVEVTGDADSDQSGLARVLVGTEALLHRVDTAEVVVFADFDQELLARRYRAGEQALALLVRAGRMVGGRRDGTGKVVVQTRQPSHPVVRAALTADTSAWSSGEQARRQLLGYPPYAALAQVSGEAAPEYVERLGNPLGVEVRGPVDGAWLVRAPDPDTLARALDQVERPKGRLRIAVDPLRL